MPVLPRWNIIGRTPSSGTITTNHEKTMNTENQSSKPENEPKQEPGEGCQKRLVRPWWDRVEPSRTIPQSPQEQEHVIPARYHRSGRYHTNRPEMPLWKQVRESLKGECPAEIAKCGNAWNVEYIVITDEALARRVAALFVKRRPEETCLRFHLMRRTGLSLPNKEITHPCQGSTDSVSDSNP